MSRKYWMADDELLNWAKGNDEEHLLYWCTPDYAESLKSDPVNYKDLMERRRGVYAAELARRRLEI